MPFTRLNTLVEQGLKVIVYGRSGVGKSTFLAQSVENDKLADVAYVDVEGGLMKTIEADPRIWYLQPESISKAGGDLQALLTSKDGSNVRTIIVDSVSMALQGEVLAASAGEQFVSPLHYGVATNVMTRMIDQSMKSNRHLFMVAGEGEIMLNGAAQGRRPSMNPAAWQTLQHRADLILFMIGDDAGNIRLMYRERVLPDGYRITAKVRAAKMLPALDEFAQKQGLTNPRYPGTIVIGNVKDPSVPRLGMNDLFDIYHKSVYGE